MAEMSAEKQQLLDWIEADRDELVRFFSDFVAAASPNPPGDTTVAVKHITDYLDGEGLPYRLIDPQPTMANVVGTFEGGGPGRHLVLNGHIDCFPVEEGDDRWTHGPWSGAVADGKVWGRGASDMKCGTSASIFTFRYLHRVREQLKGRLTLTCVSDEETFGPWGARYLHEHHPEVHGDCCLNGEPSSPYTIRFGEKGPLWLEFDIRTRGSHGAYPHLSVDPVVMAAQAVTALQTIRSRTLPALEPSVVTVGIIRGGERFNIIPMEVHLEGTVRTYDEEIRDVVESRMHQIFSGITAAGGGSYTLDYERGSPATINDAELGAAMRPTLERIVGAENVVTLDPVMGGEDFSYYANEIPGFFFRLGQVVPGTTSGGHHTPTFMADDSSVPIGMKAMAALLVDYLTMETER